MGFFSWLSARRAVVPDAEEVLFAAEKALRALLPNAEIDRAGLSLRVRMVRGAYIWNLHDFARLAPSNAEWRRDLEELAAQVASAHGGGGLSAAPESSPGPLELILRPAKRFPQDLRKGSICEKVCPGVYAIVVRPLGDGRFETVRPDELPAELEPADAIALALASIFSGVLVGDLLQPLSSELPIYTNREFHPRAAAALMVTDLWMEAARSARIAPTSLLAVAPAQSRIHVALGDSPAIVEALRLIGAASLEIEEELLSPHILRFTGTGWARHSKLS